MTTLSLKGRVSWRLGAQLLVVMLCALSLKLYYSTAGPDQLRWILAPTTFLVELVSGSQFEFEARAGYMSGNHRFLIAASCAGVNFLVTSFLMLSLRKLWRDRSRTLSWRFIPVAAVVAFVATLVANTVRISLALKLQQTPLEISWLNANQLHRFEGIFVYFGFLLLLFVLSEKLASRAASDLWRLSLSPLMIYYAVALGMPLANGGYKQGVMFWEHSLFVLLIPIPLVLLLAAPRLYRLTRDRISSIARQRVGFGRDSQSSTILG